MSAEGSHPMSHPCCCNPGKVSVEVSEATSKEGAVRRSARSKGLQAIPFLDEPSCNTIYHCFLRSVSKSSQRNFLGQRSTQDSGEKGVYYWESYEQVYQSVVSVGLGLINECNLVSSHGPGPSQARLGIYGSNCTSWMTLMLAAYSRRVVLVHIFDAWGPIHIRSIMEHSELQVVACSRADIWKFLERKPAKLRTVILFETALDEDVERAQAVGVELLSVSDLVTVHSKDSRPSPKTAYSASAEPVNAVAMPRPLDWASLVYTPGTVSRKCVILTHMNVLAPVAGMCLGLDGRRQVVNDKDVYMSILNLADAFEVTMQGLMMSCGASIAYAGPGNDIQKLVDVDMAVLRPTVVGAVPEVCRRMYSKIKAAVAKKGALSRIMYKSSMKSHTAHVSRGSRGTVLDSSVFKSLRDEFGGRLQLVVTNGVPLSESLHCDLICVLGCTVLQAYSLAECGGIVMCMPVSLWSTGTVGGPLPSCEVKLIDTATYKVNATYPSNAETFAKQSIFRGHFDKGMAGMVVPRGQVCVRGPCVSPAYFKDHSASLKAWDGMGWLHTGDDGIWNADGSMTLLGRDSHLFQIAVIASLNSLVSTESIEAVLGRSKYISQIYVHGNAARSELVAVIVPDADALLEWCRAKNISKTSIHDMCAHPKVVDLYIKEIQKQAKNGLLRDWEFPKSVFFEVDFNTLGQGFTVDNETMTPTMKLKRESLEMRYSEPIMRMYAAIHKAIHEASGPLPVSPPKATRS